MVNFKFSNNGRKCIRQILQTYQSGNESTIFRINDKNSKTLVPNVNPICRRKCWLHCKIYGKRFSNLQLSFRTNWIFIRFQTRKGDLGNKTVGIFSLPNNNKIQPGSEISLLIAKAIFKSPKKHVISSLTRKIPNSITQCFIIGRVWGFLIECGMKLESKQLRL